MARSQAVGKSIYACSLPSEPLREGGIALLEGWSESLTAEGVCDTPAGSSTDISLLSSPRGDGHFLYAGDPRRRLRM
jgi:hypothetical protein